MQCLEGPKEEFKLHSKFESSLKLFNRERTYQIYI